MRVLKFFTTEKGHFLSQKLRKVRNHLPPSYRNFLQLTSLKRSLVLYGKDKDSSVGHHVDEEGHGLVLPGGVGVEEPGGHEGPGALVQHEHVDTPPTLTSLVLVDLKQR